MNSKYVSKRCELLNEILADRLHPNFCAPLPANAYVCSRVTTPNGPDTGPSLSWFNRVISIAIHEDGTNQIDADEEFQAVEASYRVWEKLSPFLIPAQVQSRAVRIYDLTLVPLVRFVRRLAGQSVITTSLLIQMRILLCSGTKTGHTSLLGGVIALTTTTHIPQDGRIIDADIELNATNFEFTNLTNANTTALRPI